MSRSTYNSVMSIHQDLRAVAEALASDLPAISEEIRQRSRAAAPDYYRSGDAMLLEAELPSIMEALSSVIHGFRNGRDLPERASEGALEEARVAAQAGVALSDLLHTRRIGQVVLWNRILDTAVEVAPDGPRHIAVLKQAAEYHFAWNDRVTQDVVAAYEREKSAHFLRGRERHLRTIVTDLLNAVPTDTEELGYNLELEHLAVVAWGSAPKPALQTLAAQLHASVLIVEGTGGALLGWLGASRLGDSFASMFSSISTPPATYLAFGNPAFGLDGFRLGHRQAWQACRVARLRSQPVTRYRDIALESLILRDVVAARDFMVSELGPIGDDHPRTRLLRETLSAYFEAGHNAAATAARLHVHERTVTYRLKSIEERLGVPIIRRRDELAVALRLAAALDDVSDAQVALMEQSRSAAGS